MLKRNMMMNTEAAKPSCFTRHVLRPQASGDTAVVWAPLLHLRPVCAASPPPQTGLCGYKILSWRLRKDRSLPSQAPLSTQAGSAFTPRENHMWTSLLFFWLSTFFAVKSDSKNNLLLSELLPALMHRADVSAGTKDEDYSRGANFEHISTWAATEMPISLHEIFPPFAFSPSQFHCCDHIHKRERCFSVPVTVSDLGGRAVAASQNPSFKRHRQTAGDKLCGSTGSGATVLHFGPEGRKLSRELPPPAARTSSYASCCRKV